MPASTPPAAALTHLIRALTPSDDVERTHQAAVLEWIASGAELYRVAPPDTPPMHLVSYFVPFDRATGSVLLAAHRKSGLDLPPGGHCEPGESPWRTVERECVEELGVPAVPLPELGPHPIFVTVTETRGAAVARHTDVSLWHVLDLPATTRLRPDPHEFTAVRWLTLAALLAEPIARFDPHMHRFARKLRAAVEPTR